MELLNVGGGQEILKTAKETKQAVLVVARSKRTPNTGMRCVYKVQVAGGNPETEGPVPKKAEGVASGSTKNEGYKDDGKENTVFG